jgi:hypothetical protein
MVVAYRVVRSSLQGYDFFSNHIFLEVNEIA